MSDYKTMVSIPSWVEELDHSGRISGAGTAYNLVPAIYKACRIRANALTEIPFELRKGGKFYEWEDIFITPLKELLWNTEMGLLLAGRCLWLKQMRGQSLMGAQWLNPFTLDVQVNQLKRQDGVEIKRTFIQSVNGVQFGPWEDDEVVFFKEYSPSDDLAQGTSAASVSMANSQMLYYLERYASGFFEHGAMPITVLGVERNTSPDEVKRIETFFKRFASGVRNAFNVMGLRGEIKPTVITPPMDTLAIPELRDAAVRDIAWAFDIPISMMTDANYVSAAAEHRRGFYEETILPRADFIAGIINAQFLKGTGYTLVSMPEMMTMFQADEAERAGALMQLTGGGIPLKTAMEILGYDLTSEQWATIPSDDVIEQEKPEQPEDQAQADVKRWRKKAIKAATSGKSPCVPFESDSIDAETRAAIEIGLASCHTEAEVKAVFDAMKPVDMAAELRRANNLLEGLLDAD